MALFREVDRRALFLPAALRELFRALFRAELRRPFFADFLAAFLVLFLADLLADFFGLFREDDFLARVDFLVDFRADLRRGREGLLRVVEAESSNRSYEAGVEAGVGAGVFSIGSGSIQPEPDQPISM